MRLETIDPDQSILRINLDDLGWTAADWDTILAVYPYNVQPDSQFVSVLASSTGTKLPYVRADWLAFTAARAPLYNTLLKLPKSFQDLAREHGVDVEGDIKKFLAKRAGFQHSGVSRSNRLIERHAANIGYFWTSYDFSGEHPKASLFQFPLGPGGEFGFEHDGGETIFSLPNGFQGYYLNTSKGTPLDKGPTAIVQDPERKDLTVTNGISCMGCHDQGMQPKHDEIRASVAASGRDFPKRVREAIEALYPPNDVMDKIIQADGKSFTDAMRRAGLNPTLKLNGVEMINALDKAYENDLDEAVAAAELGLTKEQFTKVASDADLKLKPLLRRFEQNTIVPRNQWEIEFKQIATNLTDDQPVKLAEVPAEAKKLVVAKVPSAADIALISDKNDYHRGDTPAFTITSNRDCFLTLSDVDEKGVRNVLLPNRFEQHNFIKAGVPVKFPPNDAPYEFKMNDRGIETVIAVCTEHNIEVDGIKHDFASAAFTEVHDYTRGIARSIVVRRKEVHQAAAAHRPPVHHGEREIFRTAIKIKVK